MLTLIYSLLSSNLEVKNEEKHSMLYLTWHIPSEVVLHPAELLLSCNYFSFPLSQETKVTS